MEKNLVNKNYNDIWQNNMEIIEILASKYIGLIKVDLESGLATILRADQEPDIVNNQVPWEEILEEYKKQQICEEDKEILKNLTLEQLNIYYDRGSSIFPVELRSFSKNKTYDWIKITGQVIGNENRGILIMSQVINEDRITRKIIDLYVYQNFDYFVLLDAKNNSYTMFSGKPDKPLPPSSGSNYEEEVRLYNNRYVVPEEVEEVTSNMLIDHVCSMLEEKEYYAFNAGCFNEEGEYQRIRIQFTYYDKVAHLILLTRSDITQLHAEEQEKERRLSLALREAKHDSMTNLYNKKAMKELINSALSNQYRAQAAVLFIDIDNFKLVNDTLGHQKGDELICYLARVLARLASKDGIAGRIGGDEFLLFLPAIWDIKKIQEYANRMCHALEKKTELGIGDLPVSCSVGISLYPKDGIDYENLLYKADQALYDAKRHGKNKYSFYSLKLGEDTERKSCNKE